MICDEMFFTNRSRMTSAPTGRHSSAQGKALGFWFSRLFSPERAERGFALSGLGSFFHASPRALPWAVEGRAFSAGTGLIVVLFVMALSVHAADTNSIGLEFFETKIRPVLAESCYSCHSAKSEKLKGGLKLDTREATLKGGDSGPALVSGKPDQSLIIKAIRYTDPNLEMPPKNKKLSAEQIADFEKWVAMGAPDPRTNSVATNQFAIDWVKAREHWAFKPVQSPPVPKTKNARAVQSPLDAFVLARLETNKLSLSPAADKRTLLRRATFDLIGLPPTAEEVEAFERDQ